MISINKRGRLIKKILKTINILSDSYNGNDLKKFDNELNTYFSEKNNNCFDKEYFHILGINNVDDIKNNLLLDSELLIDERKKLIECLIGLYHISNYNNNQSEIVSPYVYEM